MTPIIKTTYYQSPSTIPNINDPFYFIILLDGEVSFSLDFGEYRCSGKNMLFLSPYQLLQWHSSNLRRVQILQFHGDFYCIEYHREEVACNGILFNNIYENPLISVTDQFFDEILQLVDRIEKMETAKESYDISVIRSYLQLILALSSKEKQLLRHQTPVIETKKQDVLNFNNLLEASFTESKSVSYYAEKYGLSVNVFSKKVKKQYGKSPSKLIQERLTLEAKKLLHLTHKSIKEIAYELGFEDEFYFSRYFKKEVGVSPKTFRTKVGISIAAK